MLIWDDGGGGGNDDDEDAESGVVDEHMAAIES